jgi:hypothetical protein
MKLPALQFYPADWRKDPGVQAMTRHDRSVWFDLLLIMHESDERGVLLLGGKPIPEDALARMLNLDNQTLNQTLSTILTYGVASRRESDGAIFCRRMVRDENLIQIRREAGKKGGNPNLLNQNGKQKPTTGDKQKPTPSSSSSSSSSDIDSLSAREGEEGELPMRHRTPSLEILKEWASRSLVPPECAELFWDSNEARGLTPDGYWQDRDGNTIKNPAAAFRAWATRWKANKTNATNPNETHRRNPARTDSSTNNASRYS